MQQCPTKGLSFEMCQAPKCWGTSPPIYPLATRCDINAVNKTGLWRNAPPPFLALSDFFPRRGPIARTFLERRQESSTNIPSSKDICVYLEGGDEKHTEELWEMYVESHEVLQQNLHAAAPRPFFVQIDFVPQSHVGQYSNIGNRTW